MDTTIILNYVLLFFSVIVGVLLSMSLYRAFIILGQIHRNLEYIDHIRNMLQKWERIPFTLIERIVSIFTK